MTTVGFLAADGDVDMSPRVRRQIAVAAFGRDWVLDIHPRPQFVDRLNLTKPWWAAGRAMVLGTLLSVLLYLHLVHLRRRSARRPRSGGWPSRWNGRWRSAPPNCASVRRGSRR
ncbi:hypothetical protein ACFQ4K_19870 [Tistrella bauzanensis]